MTRSDRQGNELRHASAVAATAFDRALDALNVYQGDPVAIVDEALADSPDFAMGHVLRGYLFGLATEPEATEEAAGTVERAAGAGSRDARALARRRARSADRRATGPRRPSGSNRHNADYPRDLLGLQAGHLMDFYRANARNLRDRIARVLPHWSPDMPGYSILLGHARLRPGGDRRLRAAPRTSAGAPSRSIRATAGRITPWPMSWRCRAAPRTASAG